MGVCAVSQSLCSYLGRIDEQDRKDAYIERCARELSQGEIVIVMQQVITAEDVLSEADQELFLPALLELLRGSSDKAASMLRHAVYEIAESKVSDLLA